MNIINLIIDFKKNNSALWIEANNIKLFVSDDFNDFERYVDDIKKIKPEILDCLILNEVFSKDAFQRRTIFKSDAGIAPLSFAQERLWFIEQYEQGTNAYHIPVVYELDSDTDVAGLEYALQQVISRHKVLRSVIEQGGNGHGIQQVHNEPLLIEKVTINNEATMDIAIRKEINRPFDLSSEYPVRVKFYMMQSTETAYKRTILLINVHHIAGDGWSMDVFQRELFAYYEAYISQTSDFSLQPLEIQYKDYAVWQRAYLTEANLTKQLSYWKEKLSGFQTLELPADFARPAEMDYHGANEIFTLNEDLSGQLRSLAQRYGVTLNSVLLGSLNVLLSKYTGQEDIVTGSPNANRHHRQTEGLIGFFVNTITNRTVLNRTQSFEELIQQVHQEQIHAQMHQDLPFEKLVEELGVQRDPSRHPVFQVMFSVQNFGNGVIASDQRKRYLKPYVAENIYEIEKFDLSITIDESLPECWIQISYATGLFRKATIERLSDHYKNLLVQLIAHPSIPYSQISLLDDKEYQEIIYTWNRTDRNHPVGKTIHQLFGEQAIRTPNNIALAFKGTQLTYRELNEKSNQLARYIRTQYLHRIKQDMIPGTLIALCLDRSLEMIIGILAIIKAGAAYVPIDVNYPQERIDYLLGDSKAALILTQRQLDKIQLPIEKVIYTDLAETLFETEDSNDLPAHSDVTDLAYVIYTSGTTGNPKGVMVEHKSVGNLIFTSANKFEVTAGSKILQYASLVFDISVWEIFNALLFGAELSIASQEMRQDVHLLYDHIAGHKISMTLLPPSLLSIMPDGLPDLKILFVGGEACAPESMRKWSEGRRLINAYGPTESTIISTWHEYKERDISTNIGRPVDNLRTYVLDAGMKPVAVGVSGELYIGGAGIARGYLNRADITRERFIANLFATENDKRNGYIRLYKTGNVVRWLPDGNLEFIGRNDDQVKIRGYRIELGEIEQSLLQINGIRQSLVLAKEKITEAGSNKYLVAYYVPDSGKKALNPETVKSALLQLLPEYMVPGIFIQMASFPLTINGKLDRRALPEPDFSEKDSYVKPVTELEVELCQIYANLLGLPVEQISTNQNFFSMGGNSIMSIRLKQKLNELPDFKHIGVADVFKYNTIHKLIQSIGSEHTAEYKLQGNTTQNTDHEIAIIGVSGAFSGVNNVDELWQLISQQQEGIRFYSKEECRQLGVDEYILENPAYVPVAGKVKDIELFDPVFWGLSPNEAKQIDPQIRKFVEHSWFALEAAGYAGQRKSSNIGVFAGSGSGTASYFYENILHGELADQINVWEAAVSNNKSALATRTAYLLGLTGPANSIDTACSTGLVSVVEACQKLRLGVCDMALAGGVSLGMPDHVGYIHEEGMIESKDGHCRTFDITSSGTTGGTGVGVVLLKRLGDAIKNKDNILGVIKGYATNNDGDRKTGYTAPSVTGQAECIINAQKMACITPNQIDYIECHGTGTHLGDPIEVQALKEAFEFNGSRKKQTNNKTVLGAVKANIGHTDSAAGTAGLIKICAMLQNSVMPGQVNYTAPNPELQLDQTDFEIITENRPWLPAENRQRIAAVSSFGIGGTNAHVIIGDYVAVPQSIEKKKTPVNYIIPLSAKNRQSLENYKESLIQYLSGKGDQINLADVAYTLSERREHFSYRCAYTATSIDELVLKLSEPTVYGQANMENSNAIVFIFPGQGAQYYQMAKGLYDNDLFFKDTVDQLIAIANNHLSIDLFDVMYPGDGTQHHNINETEWSQISLFIVEYALAKYLEHLDVKASGYIGHSLGEFVSATLSGVFTIEQAIKIVIARGRLMQAMQLGRMLGINAKEEAVKIIAEKHDCEIAVINSADDIVVSGTIADITSLKQSLDSLTIPAVILTTSHAYHSRMMADAAKQFEEVFKTITLCKPERIFISNVTGEIAGAEVMTGEYWCKQLSNTVQFAKGTSNLARHYNNQVTFIEVGPGKALGSFINKYKTAIGNKSIATIQLLPTAKELSAAGYTFSGISNKEDCMARLWMYGVINKVNDGNYFEDASVQPGLPTYQFAYQKCWINKPARNFTSANKTAFINKVRKGIDDLSALSKDSIIDLLETILSPDISKTDIVDNKAHINIIEDNYSEKEYQVAIIFGELLGVEQISLHDDFFRIGGNSILAIQLSHRIGKVLESDVKVADVFEHKTIAQLILNCTGQVENNIPKIEADRAALSFAQERLWFIEQYAEGTNAYHLPAVFELDDDTDIEGMKYALRQIVVRHEVLRSTIGQADGQEHGTQQVHDEPLAIETITLTETKECEILVREDINRPFDLSSEYPVRVKFYTIQSDVDSIPSQPGKTILLINAHHIASDGWSMDIFQRELFAYYEAFINRDSHFRLPELDIQYKDYAVWQRNYLTGSILEKQLGYWKNKLVGYQTLEFPTDFVRPGEVDYKGSAEVIVLDQKISIKLRALARHHGVTLHSVLLSSLNILLGKYTGQDDIITGSPIANRHHRQTEDLIGFFVNTQANRTILDWSQNYEELIQQVHQEQVQAQLHQDLPFERLVNELGVARDASRHPVFQVMFGVQSFGNRGKAAGQQKAYFKPYQSSGIYEVEKFDLSIFVDDGQEELVMQVGYATSLFHKDTILRLIGHYTHLLGQLTGAPAQPYGQFSLLDAEEYEQIIYRWNETDKDYPADKTIYQLFQKQAQQIPDNIALVYEDQCLTYRELDEKSNQLARVIRAEYKQRTKRSLAPDTIIALYVDRSLEMVICMLAIQKAGGAYLPLDINYPQERIDYLLADSRAELILTQKESGHAQLPSQNILYIDLAEEFYKKENNSKLRLYSKATNLAYVIYTSGTTGMPKGVMVEHKGVSNLVFVQKDKFEISARSKVLQYSSVVFDASVWEIFSTLALGAELFIASASIRQDVHLLHQYLAHNKISTAYLPPVLISILPPDLPYLKTLVAGGEICSLEAMNKWGNGRKFINAYGPTEITVCSTFHQHQPGDINTNIGRPVYNTSVYVLDTALNPVPAGIIGELYIGGAGVTRGYLNRPELTNERFIPNRFATEADKAKGYTRLYKTGDLVRWLPNGNLEFLGRNDDQVKIRGFRIELGEIENALSQIAGISQSCVVAREKTTGAGTNKYLAAYYTLDQSDDVLTQDMVAARLREILPEYMVPGILIHMDSFPMTINGKLDKKALPEPDFTLSDVFVAPVTEMETIMCSIWQEVLDIDQIGITDDFFKIGGNSILAIQVSHRMSKALGYDVKIADLFKCKTISQLLSDSTDRSRTNIPKVDASQSILSFAQQRLWFIEQYANGTNAYHIPAVFELDADTDVAGIKYAIQQIVSRHEVLRSTIESTDGSEQAIQKVHERPLVIEEITLVDQAECEALVKEDINRPFDLSTEYPIRVKLYTLHFVGAANRIVNNRTFLLVNMHHIASDGWSMDVLQRELHAYYGAFINKDATFSLPALEIQYKDYAVWQRSYLTGPVLAKQLGYWKDKLTGYQNLELPTDNARPGVIDYCGASETFTLDSATSWQLRALAQHCGVTLHSVLLSSINILLSKYTGQEDIVTGTPNANRHHRQTEGLIGFFVNTIANRTVLSTSQSFSGLVKQVQEEQVQAQLNQDLPFEKLIDELGVARDPSRHPVFQVMFSVQSFGNQTESFGQQKAYLKPYHSADIYQVEKFDLSVFIDDSQEELLGQISYATSLFHKATIERLIKHYIQLLTQLVAAPEQSYSGVSLLTPEENNQIVHQWNKTDKHYPQNALVDICLKSIENKADSIAVIDATGSYTYQHIGAYSYHISGYLFDRGLSERNGLVAILSEKGYQQVVSILGIIWSGAAYLPLHIEWPTTRMDDVLTEGKVRSVLVTSAQYNGSIAGSHIEHKYEWLIIEEIISYHPVVTRAQLPQVQLGNVAYVIFTSGSTGKPKGVAIPHYGAVNTIHAVNDEFKVTSKDRVLALSELSFDLSVYDVFGLLAAGGTIIFPEQDKTRDPAHWFELIQRHSITMWNTVPQLMQLLADFTARTGQDLKALRVVMLSGDWIPLKLPVQIRQLNQKAIIMSLGGATEGSIWSMWYAVNEIDPEWVSIPYGHPMPNQEMYVLDEQDNHCPVGIQGEIHIGGIGVALGYWGDEERTKARFIDHKNLGRLYKTGDKGKWSRHGYVIFEGRNDDQVKINGFRIELGEIEHTLSLVEGIQQSCVVAKMRKTETGNAKYLVAYYVPASNDNTVTQAFIQSRLLLTLPEYMVPGAFVAMDSLPLSANGKLDKKALPDPDFTVSSAGYVAPANETESDLCRIWQDVLGLEKVGLTDDFFRIGGDSILSIQVSSRMRQAGFNCQVRDIFECKTISRLLEQINKRSSGVAIKSEQGRLIGVSELLPIQQWFVEKVQKGDIEHINHWNQSFLIRVPELDVQKLVSAIEALVAHHDVLRIRFTKEQDHWKQVYQANVVLPLHRVLDVSAHEYEKVQQILTDWQSGFDLENGPLFQAGYLHGYADGSARVYFALHHMIVDAVSWRIIAEDLKTLYAGRALPQKGSSYRQWIAAVNQYAEQHPTEVSWWEAQLNGIPSYEADLQDEMPGTAMFELDADQTGLLLQKAQQAYHTDINDLLLVALAYALKDINGQDIQGITLEGHGREDIDTSMDTSQTVGWFTTMLPVRLELKGTLKDSIRFIKESLRKIPNKGIGFGSFATNPSIGYSYSDLPPVSFNYLGQFDKQEGDWQIVAEGSGMSMYTADAELNVIGINGMVRNGSLMFSVATKLGSQTTMLLKDSFKIQLTNIIGHCVEKLDQDGDSYTPADFGSVRISQSLLDQLSADARMNGNEIAHICLANSLQQGFVYHALSHTGDDAYRVQLVYDFHATLDVETYMRAWEYCTAQYPILRTAFNWDEEIIQVIYKHGILGCQLHDISHLATDVEKDAAIEEIRSADRIQSFDLSRPGLLRIHIIKQAPDHYTIIKSEHHSISDGWSGPVLLTSLHQYYEALKNHKTVSIKEDTAYIRAQEYISRQKGVYQAYWSEALSGIESTVDISSLLSVSIDTGSYRYVSQPATATLHIKGDLYDHIKAFSQSEGITMNVIVQFVWHKLLQVYGNTLQSVAGTTVSGRDLPIEGIEESVGLYINTLPLIINWDNDDTIHTQLHLIQKKITELNTHSAANLAKLQRNGERMFHSLFVFENYPAPKGGGDMARISVRNAVEKVDYPLNIKAFEQGEALTIDLGYDAEYLTENKAQQHIATLERIFRQVIKDPQQSHNRISLLSQDEYNQVIYKWNETDKPYTKDRTIHEMFQAQAARTPNDIALVYEGKQLSYRELDEKSNQLARHIRSQYLQVVHQTLGPDTLIALYLDRGFEMLIGILAVLKAGGAYVPVDTNYPQDRVDYLLEDTAARLILSQRGLRKNRSIHLPDEKIIHIDLQEALYHVEDASALPLFSMSSDLAYVIYTSGTTGKPKGVMLPHSGIVNRLEWMQSMYPLGAGDVVLLKTPYVFDVSVWEILWANWYGAKIVIAKPDGHKDSDYLHQLIEQNAVTTVHFVPGMLEAYNHYVIEQQSAFSSTLRQMFCSGEALNKNTVQLAYKNAANEYFHLHNLYGPTEASIDVTFFETSPNENVYIGKPIQNTQTYVLDRYGAPVPVGVVGELYLGGAGLARGYLNRPELTAERFIPDPFATEAGRANGYTRLYKTGDLVRLLPDGNIDYIGRNDSQVKIRGFRIELGEIEHALLQIPGIKQSVVLAKERKTESGNTKYLVAYYVSANSETTPAEDDIRSMLSAMLPEYMVPAIYVGLSSMPLTVNGKLDRSALPEPGFSASLEEYVAPVSETEILLCNILQEVLGLKRVGITDDFFRIGGDSILSIQVSSRIRQAGINSQVRDIFEYRTVGKLAAQLAQRNTVADIKTEQGILTGKFDLLPVQQWFTGQVDSGAFAAPGHWNQSFLVKVPQLDALKLKFVIEELVTYHDMLRVRFIKEPSVYPGREDWKQEYQPITGPCNFKTLDVSIRTPEEIQELLTGWQASFNIEDGHVFQAGYLYGYEDGSARIYFALHHLIIDAVSWRILAEDTMTLYSGKKLPQKTSSYRQWVAAAQHYAVQHPTEKMYWEGQLNGISTTWINTTAKQPTAAFFEIDKTLTRLLLHEAAKAHQTEINDLLLTALAYALKEINGLHTQGITLEGHGREDIDVSLDTSHTLGWFTTMFPVKLELQDTLRESIEFIKESLRNIPGKGIGFGTFVTDQATTYSYEDLPPVSFNYLGQFEAQDNGDWQVIPEGSGDSVSPLNEDRNRININGMIRNGTLVFSVVTKLGASDTNRLADALKYHLEQIINYCEKLYHDKGIGYTPSDFKDFVPYEIINGHLDEHPVFILPPGEGGAESYYDNIVPALKNRKIILFNNYYYYLRSRNISNADYTIEDLARYYRLLIRNLQPSGKYTFLGWSFGGLLAFEIAMQLLNDGAEINKLIVLDSFFNVRDAERYIPQEYIDISRKTINYKYNKQYGFVDFDIVMFRARQQFKEIDMVIDVEESEKEIFKGYVKHFFETEYNGLDKLFVDGADQLKNRVEVIDVETHHNNVPYAIRADIINYV